MKDETKNIPPPRGYKLTLINLDTGKEVINEEIDCLVGSYHKTDHKKTEVSGLRLAATTNGVILTTTFAAKETVDKMMEDITSDLLTSLKNDKELNELLQALKK